MKGQASGNGSDEFRVDEVDMGRHIPNGENR
jgi:hypothetical protein